jgi:hypothetical protein
MNTMNTMNTMNIMNTILLVLLTSNISTSIKWSIPIDEPIIKKAYRSISDSDTLLCNLCDNPQIVTNPHDYLIQLYTKNYIYYANKTTGIIIEKIQIIDNMINIDPKPDNCYSTKPNMVCNREVIYNGSLYVIIINNTWLPNNKCHINHYHSNVDCYNQENVSIKLKKLV